MMRGCPVSTLLSVTSLCFFFFNDTATTEIYTLSLHDALPIWHRSRREKDCPFPQGPRWHRDGRSEEHTSELQSLAYLVCRLLLEKKATPRCSFCITASPSTSVHDQWSSATFRSCRRSTAVFFCAGRGRTSFHLFPSAPPPNS